LDFLDQKITHAGCEHIPNDVQEDDARMELISDDDVGMVHRTKEFLHHPLLLAHRLQEKGVV
jgi:hypothetical protein